MQALTRLAALGGSDRRLALGAAMLVGAAAIAVWLFSTRRLLSTCEGKAARFVLGGLLGAETDCERIAWAVASASRHIPLAPTCLPQAIAAWALMRRAGTPVEFRIGVTGGQGTRVRGHAWVESAGRVVFGGAESDRYVPLVPTRSVR
jgi:hypothetical protein